MHTFNPKITPKTAGVYALKHITTTRLYIGVTKNLKKRMQEWKHCIIHRKTTGNPLLDSVIAETTLYDWEFIVLIECPEDYMIMEHLEDRAIAQVPRDRLLNKYKVKNSSVHPPRSGQNASHTQN
jgi:hypothetical protein